MSGGSNKDTTNTTNNNITDRSIDNREYDNRVSNTQVTDFESVSKAFDFGHRTLDTVDRTIQSNNSAVDGAFNFGKNAFALTGDALFSAFNFADNALNQSLTEAANSRTILADSLNSRQQETRETSGLIRLLIIAATLGITVIFIFGKRK